MPSKIELARSTKGAESCELTERPTQVSQRLGHNNNCSDWLAVSPRVHSHGMPASSRVNRGLRRAQPADLESQQCFR